MVDSRTPRTHACNLPLNATFYRTDRKLIRTTWITRLVQNFRNYTTISNIRPNTNSLFRSTKNIIEEKRRHLDSKFWFIIHPFSLFQFHWKLIMAFLYLIVILLDLYHVVVMVKSEEFTYRAFTNAYWFFNCIYVADIFINFLTGYVESYAKPIVFYAAGIQKTLSERVVLAPRKIAVHYLRTFFLIDAITFSDLLIFLYHSNDKTVWYNFAMIRLLRFVRLCSTYRTIRINLSSPNCSTYKHGYTLFICVFVCFLFAYIFGFLYLFVPDLILFYQGETSKNYTNLCGVKYNIWQTDMPTNSEIFRLAILRSFGILFGVPMLDKYFEDTESSKVVLFLNRLAGYVTRAIFLYNIFVCFQKVEESRIKYEAFMKEVETLMSAKKLTNQTRHRIVKYFENTLKSEFFNEVEILNALNSRMRTEIFVHSSMDLVRTCHLFSNLPNDIVSSLALRLKHETYIPGIYIVRVGEVAKCMYFIATGTVAIYNKRGAEICHLGDGEYFGEIGLLSITSSTRSADVITLENSELYRLDIKDFHQVVKPNSLIYHRLRQLSIHRLSMRRRTFI